MALDAVMIRMIKNELQKAVGARVNQVNQPNKDEILLTLRTFDGTNKLLLSARANSPRVQFTAVAPENPKSPFMLCMLLRKKLCGAKLCAVSQPSFERILFFDFEATNEIGDRENLRLVCEIMGKYSNVILVDGNGLIVDSLKRVDMTVSSKRLVLPRLLYELAPSQDKSSLLDSAVAELADKITGCDMPLDKAILSTVQGLSPIICREISYRLGDPVATIADKKLLCDELSKFVADIDSGKSTPTMLIKPDGKPFDLAFCDINQYGSSVTKRNFDTYSEMLDSFYGERDSIERMKVKSASIHKLLTNIIARLSKKINTLSIDLKKTENREQLRIRGDLLQANLYRVERGASFVEVENFYDENGGTLKINLDPSITPAQNAQKFYKKYAKAKTAEKMLKIQIEKAQSELAYIVSVLDFLSRATNESELSAIKEELTLQGYIKSPKGKTKSQQALPPLEYMSSDGMKILVGRNNRQNDLLTLKTAGKNDMWFHTKDIPGSHTVVLSNGRELSDKAIMEAAAIAASHSKAKDSSQVPVDYTLIRHVSKPQGAKPGKVIYTNYHTVYVSPQKTE